MLERMLTWCAVAALALAVVVWPVALLLQGGAVEAIPIEKHDAARIEIQKATFDPAEADDDLAVAEIYGTPPEAAARKRYVWPPAERLIRPEEKEGVVLFDLRTSSGGGLGDWMARMQVKTLWFLARWIAIGAAAVGIVLLALRAWRRARVRKGRGQAPAGD
jgi:hypothetical protein